MSAVTWVRCVLALLVISGPAGAQDEPTPKSEAVPTRDAPSSAEGGGRDDDARAIGGLVDAFVAAYNSGDAAALGALFTKEAEVEDEDGEVTHGRDAIVERFTGFFAEEPQGTLDVAVESLRFLGPDLAIEEGLGDALAWRGRTPRSNRYSVLYTREGDRWLHARIRDEPAPLVSPHERLQELEWMLGEWVNESDAGVVHTTFAWSEDGNFLLRDFDVMIEGQVALSGTQRIGWDSLHQQFRTWVFDTGGGFAEGLMAHDGDQWVVKGTGVRSDGLAVTATNFITVLGPDRVAWQTVDRTVGGVAMPDIDQFVLV